MTYGGTFLPGLCCRGFSVRLRPRGALWRLVPGDQRELLFNRVRVNVLSWPRGQYWSRSWLGEGNGNPFQCSSLGNPMDRGGWQSTAHRVAKSRTQFSHWVVSDSLRPHGLQHARPPCPSPTPGVYSNSCPLSWWCHPAISSSVIPFSSCLQSFPASGSFPMSQFFTSGGQSVGVSALTTVLPMNIQVWFPLGLTGLTLLQSKELSRVFSNTTVQKHQLFSTQLSL